MKPITRLIVVELNGIDFYYMPHKVKMRAGWKCLVSGSADVAIPIPPRKVPLSVRQTIHAMEKATITYDHSKSLALLHRLRAGVSGVGADVPDCKS